MNIFSKTCVGLLAFSLHALPINAAAEHASPNAGSASVGTLTKTEKANLNSWLVGEANTARRWEKVQTYLRGFDQPMLETGQRYQAIYQALKDNNYDLAVYHWKKIRTTIENGYMKRPKREKNAKLLLLDSVWQRVLDDFNSQQPTRAAQGFAAAKAACMSCHMAENKGFINDQPMFRLSQINNGGK